MAQALEVNFTVVGPNVEGATQVAPTGISPSLDPIPCEARMTRGAFLSLPRLGFTLGYFSVRAMHAPANAHFENDVFG